MGIGSVHEEELQNDLTVWSRQMTPFRCMLSKAISKLLNYEEFLLSRDHMMRAEIAQFNRKKPDVASHNLHPSSPRLSPQPQMWFIQPGGKERERSELHIIIMHLAESEWVKFIRSRLRMCFQLTVSSFVSHGKRSNLQSRTRTDSISLLCCLPSRCYWELLPSNWRNRRRSSCISDCMMLSYVVSRVFRRKRKRSGN